MASKIQENLEQSNNVYITTFTEGHLALPPAKKYAVLTCMDARIDPARAFGINLGDAHVIRNAGASAKDALRSLVISEQLLGTQEILLIKHTGCGMLTFKNEDAHAAVRTNLGEAAAAEIGGLDFLPFPELEEAVREDVRFLKGSKVIPEAVTISGWVYEVETGKARRVV
ncbi:beta carbonic anhydrase clade D [Eremomyces bilateralis CBS 781.70]|uniref:Carbonic anhydrase n=1 Tax=Eremomyces bilateralis CBS 781.70 TaxID=1392243 RepID=A0A6G1FWX8_9PEZI|nr:beta carbonic anhydrase clade D [Eremomyces bilateralis CBS 781.70]KAF1810176.1 beta carbonic anhydrase clade D [Eremomyces bilateralis CBS 781.70]